MYHDCAKCYVDTFLITTHHISYLLFPGGPEQLSSHAEVVMLDFATAMLSGLERWMLTAGPAMIDLNTFCDTSDKLMSSVSVLDEVQKRLYTDEVCLTPVLHCFQW